MVNADQERKRKEKEALMEKLKKQDDERKKRKKAEREEKERESRRYQAMKDDQERLVQEQKDREALAKKELEEEKQRRKWLQEQDEKIRVEAEKKITSEESWIENGKTEIPCLFDRRSAYTSQLSSLPLDLEEAIRTKAFKRNELRYKSCMIPLDSHVNSDCLSSLVAYFLQNSSMHKIYENEHKSLAFSKKCFPFRCLSIQMGVARAPLSKCSLKSLSQAADKDYQKNAIRVLCMLFDTKEDLATSGLNFEEVLKDVKLSTVVKHESLKYMVGNYDTFIKGLAKKYHQQRQTQEFPFPIKSVKAGLVEFENPKDIEIMTSTATLSNIAFYLQYTKQDDASPMEYKESWDLFRRQPSFYAFNFKKPSYTKWAAPKKGRKTRILTKYKSFEFENVCVILKDLSYDPIVKCKADNSLAYLLKKSLKEDLDVVGLRMVYLEQKHKDEYYKIFHQKIELSATWEKPVLALVLRGLDASSKVESILGHFNPETARMTVQKSLRACFGRSMEDNCVMQIFDHSKQQLSLKYWFGGRVKPEKFDISK